LTSGRSRFLDQGEHVPALLKAEPDAKAHPGESRTGSIM